MSRGRFESFTTAQMPQANGRRFKIESVPRGWGVIKRGVFPPEYEPPVAYFQWQYTQNATGLVIRSNWFPVRIDGLICPQPSAITGWTRTINTWVEPGCIVTVESVL